VAAERTVLYFVITSKNGAVLHAAKRQKGLFEKEETK